VINEKLYVQRGKDTVWQHVAKGVVVEREKKLVYFALIFHILFQSMPMIEYEQM